jgi:hypothetical protein
MPGTQAAPVDVPGGLVNGFKLALLIWFAFDAVVLVASIGKTRKPLTPGVAAGVLILVGAQAALVAAA